MIEYTAVLLNVSFLAKQMTITVDIKKKRMVQCKILYHGTDFAIHVSTPSRVGGDMGFLINPWVWFLQANMVLIVLPLARTPYKIPIISVKAHSPSRTNTTDPEHNSTECVQN